MALLRARNDKRKWSRRLVDDETRDFVHHVLEETGELFRTASGEFQLAHLTRSVFASGETRDIAWLKQRGTDPQAFYERELKPHWEGLEREARAARIERFIELSNTLGAVTDTNEPLDEFIDLVATVHLKVLLLAWAYDRTYSYIDRIFNGPLQYRNHRFRVAGGQFRRGRASSGLNGRLSARD